MLATYGGLDTMRSNVPMPIGGFSSASALRQMVRFWWLRRRFSLLTVRASSLMSTMTTRAAGSSCASAQPMQPLPEQRSRMRAFIFRPTSTRSAASTSTSVSMRGMSTSGVTTIGSP